MNAKQSLEKLLNAERKISKDLKAQIEQLMKEKIGEIMSNPNPVKENAGVTEGGPEIISPPQDLSNELADLQTQIQK